jgi:hypothetical protein
MNIGKPGRLVSQGRYLVTPAQQAVDSTDKYADSTTCTLAVYKNRHPTAQRTFHRLT